jgi:TPR repeat protein
VCFRVVPAGFFITATSLIGLAGACYIFSSTPAGGMVMYGRNLFTKITGLCLFAGISPVWCGLDEAIVEYQDGNYVAALVEFQSLADQGDAVAQYNLAVMYEYGQGVPQAYALAAMWYWRSAEQGTDLAQYNLGVLYEKGHGVPRDFIKSVEWYTRAAQQGLDLAQYNLGVMYEKGRGVPRDLATAIEWYRKAARQGDADAQNNLGDMYYFGNGVPQNYLLAHMWYNLASANGHEPAAINRDRVAARLSPEQIVTAQKLAEDWIKQQLENGDHQKAAD